MQAMKGATGVLGNMNRSMNLPALQRIAMEFERENDIMDQRQEMMDDAIDDVTGLEDEAEGEEVVEQVLEEIGVDLKNSVSLDCACVRAYLSGYLVDCLTRWVKPLKVFRLQQFPKAELRRLLEDQLGIREMMISKQDWTV
jgi:division protein CdvB (Snf7/Vps24/ESCRT-III family)